MENQGPARHDLFVRQPKAFERLSVERCRLDIWGLSGVALHHNVKDLAIRQVNFASGKSGEPIAYRGIPGVT
jgi:hypothetical protein